MGAEAIRAAVERELDAEPGVLMDLEVLAEPVAAERARDGRALRVRAPRGEVDERDLRDRIEAFERARIVDAQLAGRERSGLVEDDAADARRAVEERRRAHEQPLAAKARLHDLVGKRRRDAEGAG